MEIVDRTARSLALVSGGVGVAAGLTLIGFFAFRSIGRVPLGPVNDVLGAVQLATLAPVAGALVRRLPRSRTVRVATAVAVVAMGAFVLLSVALVAEVLTFAQQIGPLLAAILTVYSWLLVINLVAHRHRTLSRAVTRTGVLIGVGLITGLVLAGAAYAMPGIVGQLVSGLGYGLAGLAWLGLPAYVLLLATRVFSVPSPSGVLAPAHPVQGARS